MNTADGVATTDKEALYAQRFARYTTAMRNELPDRVPIRPFVAEFTGVYAGYNCQQLAHDYQQAFEAACKCAADFDWDAVVANMVYVWTGLAQSMGLKYYAIPGLEIPVDTGFQYREPPQNDAFMKPDEYDALIEDPTGFLYNVWLPRVSTQLAPIGSPVTYRHNLALVRTSMAMMQYFYAFGPQVDRLRKECGTASAIAGILKAPLDILADKLRGYLGLVDDLFERRDKVVAACEALRPAPGSRGENHRGSVVQCPRGAMDAPRWRTVCLPRDLQEHLLGDAQTDRPGAVGRRSPDAVLCRRQLGLPPGFVRRTA